MPTAIGCDLKSSNALRPASFTAVGALAASAGDQVALTTIAWSTRVPRIETAAAPIAA